MNCAWCEHPNADEHKYCAWCGHPLDSELSQMRRYIDERVASQLEAELKRLRDVDVIVTETANRIIAKAWSCATIYLRALSVLTTVAALALFVLGYSSWETIKKKAEGKLDAFVSSMEVSEESRLKNTVNAQINTFKLDSGVGNIAGLLGDVANLQQQMKATPAGVASVNLFDSLVAQRRVLGVDVSHRAGEANWANLKAGGISFAFVKATQGATFNDPQFANNIGQCIQAQLICGAYHYFTSTPGTDQARSFIRAVKQYPSILIAIDVEPGFGTGISAERSLDDFIATVEHDLGRRPILYTTATGWPQLQFSSRFAAYPLWLAYFPSSAVSQPVQLSPWSVWTFWQFTDSREMRGLTGPQNVSVFNGTLDQLRGLMR